MSTNETDIVKLNLNDTFYDWYLRTNQIIDYVNPINVYDVFAGNGLSESRTGTPGTIELSVDTAPALYGITTLVDTNDGSSVVALDFSSLTVGTVANTSIFSFQDASSQIYKVQASDILPPDINDDHTFNGAIIVADLTVNDGNITLVADTSTEGNKAGLFVTGLDTDNVFFTYDPETSAWYSSHNYGVTSGTGFVTDSTGDAVYPFIASETQAQIDLQLQSTVSGIPERFSVFAEFDAANTLTFSHYSNGSLVSDILELTSTGTNGSSVVVKDTITITDVLNSTPFTQSPAAESVPVTDSTDGFLNEFVNRVKLPTGDGSIAAGDFVYVDSSGELQKTDPTTISETYQIGIVESVASGNAIVITSGPFDGLLSGLSAGDIYYLDTVTPGNITNIDPTSETNGTIGKPVFIATTATSGILIPDFTNLGGGTIITGGGGGTVNDAYKTITIDSTNIVANGEDEITFISGTNISLTGNAGTYEVTIDSNIPEPGTNDAYSLLTADSSSSYLYTSLGESSVIGRVTNGELQSISLTEGTILGRGTGTEDNGVEALSGSQVLDILGFSGNSFLKTVNFETVSGGTVYSYPDTDDGETLTIRAGSNISFDFIGGYLYINADAIGSTDGGGGGGPIGVAISGDSSFTPADNITFGGVGGYITFSKTVVGTNVQITGTPSSDYLPMSTSTGSVNHTPGATLSFLGGNGVSVSHSVSSGNTNISISLNDKINIKTIDTLAGPFRLWTNERSSAAEPSGEPWTFEVKDYSYLEKTALLGSDGADVRDSSVTINTFDDIVYPDTVRQSTFLSGSSGNDYYHNRCVSMFADCIFDAGTGSNPLSYVTDPESGLRPTIPFRFYEIIVDKLRVHDLVVDTAAKTREFLGTVFGIFGGSGSQTSIVKFSTNTLNFGGSQGASGENGVQLFFEDDADTGDSSSATIFKPSKAYIDSTLTNLPYRTFVIADHITFGASDTDGNQDTTLYSPVLGRGSADTLSISNEAGSVVELSLTANDINDVFDIGMQSGTNGYSYLDYNDGTTSWYLHLGQDLEIITNSLTIKNNSGGGITFTNSSFTSTDTGKLMMISSVDTTGLATIEPTYVIKPYNGGATIATDPINTLYYVV